MKNELKIEGKISEVVDFNSRNSYFDSKVFEGYVNLKKDNEEILNKEIYIQENKQMRSSEDLNLIKIIYMTPYDHFIENMLNNTIEVIKEGDKDKIVKLLKLFDENIIGFEVLPNLKQNSSSIYINHKIYNLMPLSSFGDGVKKVLTLASGLINAKNGILLIDEIETAIYKDMINDVFKWFVKSCMEYNVQLICTTHSLEVIDSIVEGMENNISKLACFRIETIDNDMNATRFSGSKLKDIRTILGQDVR
ncbi:ATP-binding protein [Paraclostridium sordellii]|nr:ATP-binding protein [Paeniclostridium sordellii]